MKRIMLLIIAMLLSAMLSMMAIANENNYFNGDILFRDHEWGESLEEVMKTEIEDGMVEDVDYAIDRDGYQLYIPDQTIGGCNMDIMFRFTDDWELCEGVYLLRETHADENSYYKDFTSLVEKLTDKYGEPSYSEDDWQNDLFKDDPKKIGLAIAAEQLVLTRAWMSSTNGAYIISLCSGNNYDISVTVRYFPSPDSGLKAHADSNDGL